LEQWPSGINFCFFPAGTLLDMILWTQAGAGTIFLHENQIRCFEQIIWKTWIH
jgi:hypothetical protein